MTQRRPRVTDGLSEPGPPHFRQALVGDVAEDEGLGDIARQYVRVTVNFAKRVAGRTPVIPAELISLSSLRDLGDEDLLGVLLLDGIHAPPERFQLYG